MANVDFDDSGNGGVEDDTRLCATLPPNFRTSLTQLTNVTWCRLMTMYEENTIECYPTKPEPDETPFVKLSLTSSTGPNWEYRLLDGHSRPPRALRLRAADASTDPGAHPVQESCARLFRAFPTMASLEADIDDTVLTGLFVASRRRPLGRPVVCPGLARIILNDKWGHLKGVRVEPVFNLLVRGLLYRVERGRDVLCWKSCV